MKNSKRRRSTDRRLSILVLIAAIVAIPIVFAVVGARQSPPAAVAPTFDPDRTGPPPTVEGLWRIKGVVTDPVGTPISGVCIAIGPLGCNPQSPRTDNSGWYFFDLPVANVDYDLHFTKDGYRRFDSRFHPEGPTYIDAVILAPQ